MEKIAAKKVIGALLLLFWCFRFIDYTGEVTVVGGFMNELQCEGYRKVMVIRERSKTEKCEPLTDKIVRGEMERGV